MRAKRLQISLFIILILASTSLYAADDKEITIHNITPAVINDSLYISAQITNLFSPKNLSTLQSGLQSLLKIDIEVIQHGGDASLISGSFTLAAIELGKSLSYNIWDELYYISGQNGRQNYADQGIFLKNASSLNNVAVLPKDMLPESASYSIRMMVQFFPISEEQKDKVEAWLSNPNKTKYTLASDERNNRFQLTSGKMVSLLMGGKRRPKNSSKWFSSDIYNLTQLTGQ